MNTATVALGAGGRSLSGDVRDWVKSLPAGTWFRTDSVPGPRHVVRLVLSRLMDAETPLIGRAARGIYWRQPPPASFVYGTPPLLTGGAASVLAPPGSGYAEHSALNCIGWSRQVPIRTSIAVPYRNLTPPALAGGAPPPIFVERSNRRRRRLNWNEATLLEAVKTLGAADFHNWDHAMWCLLEANGWMQRGHPIRKSELLWAAEEEPASRKWTAGRGDRSFDAVIGRLSDELPALLHPPAEPFPPDEPRHGVAYPIR